MMLATNSPDNPVICPKRAPVTNAQQRPCPDCGHPLVVQAPLTRTVADQPPETYLPAHCWQPSCATKLSTRQGYRWQPALHRFPLPDQKEGHMNDLGERVKLKLKKLGLTQGELADDLGYDRSYLSNLLNGRPGSGPARQKLEKWLGCEAPAGDLEGLGNALATLQAERDDLAAEREELARQLDAARAEIEGLREALLLAEERKAHEKALAKSDPGESEAYGALTVQWAASAARERALKRALLDLLADRLPNSVLAVLRETFWGVSDGRG